MSKDYYTVLGVEKGSSKDEIKKAYKKLAKKYHPDISKEDDAEAKFKEINEAAGVLLDDQKRQQYDTYGSADGPQGFGGFGGGGGFNPQDFGINLDDIFESFGFGGGGGFGGRRSRSRKNTTVKAEVVLSLEEAYSGVEKSVQIRRHIKCETCEGKGAENADDVQTCSTCGGSGVVTEMQRSFLGAIRTQRPCPVCHGKGTTVKNPCGSCHGEGFKDTMDTVTITIPAGIQSGVTLRVTGKGHYDPELDGYGDLYLSVHVQNKTRFVVDQEDLRTEVTVSFIEAIVGCEKKIDHVGGTTLTVKIPAGVQPETTLRVKDKGMPLLNYDGHGHLYVKVKVEIPKKTNAEQKKILAQYAKTLEDKSLFNKIKHWFK